MVARGTYLLAIIASWPTAISMYSTPPSARRTWVDQLIGRFPRRLLHARQMRDSVQSIVANIGEGFGRGGGRDRARPLEIARGEAEETISHLGANFRTKRIAPADYWPIRNLLVVIVKMLNSLLRR